MAHTAPSLCFTCGAKFDTCGKLDKHVMIFHVLAEILNNSNKKGETEKNRATVFERKLLTSGLQVKCDVIRDGNCQFRAVSDQLSRFNIHHDHLALRLLAVNYLRDNPFMNDGTHLSFFVEDINEYGSWDGYLKYMSKMGNWGDHLTLYALSQLLHRPIHVITSEQGNNFDVIIEPVDQGDIEAKLLLGYVEQVHYVSLEVAVMLGNNVMESPHLEDCVLTISDSSDSEPRNTSGTDSDAAEFSLKTEFHEIDNDLAMKFSYGGRKGGEVILPTRRDFKYSEFNRFQCSEKKNTESKKRKLSSKQKSMSSPKTKVCRQDNRRQAISHFGECRRDNEKMVIDLTDIMSELSSEDSPRKVASAPPGSSISCKQKLNFQHVLSSDSEAIVISSESEEENCNDHCKSKTDFINQHPVYSRESKGFDGRQVLTDIIMGNFEKCKICKTVPMGVCETASFVIAIDGDNMKSKDLTCDDNGIWGGGHCSPTTHYSVEIDDGNVHVNRVSKYSKQHGNIYKLHRQYSTHVTETFKRIVYRVTKPTGELCKYAIVQYMFTDGQQKEIIIRPHGNNTKSGCEGYFRTKPTVMEKMKKETESAPPKTVVTKLNNAAGGVLQAKSVSHMVRNRKQVENASYMSHRKEERLYDQKGTKHGPCRNTDFNKLIAMQYTGDFVKDVSFNSGGSKKREKKGVPNTFAATEQQLFDVNKFCNSDHKSVLGIDPTYLLGNYYLTVSTFQHPMFVIRGSSRHPTVMGPVMTHVTRDADDYYFFGMNLKKHGVSSLKVWGSDGEAALEKGFGSVYGEDTSKTIHLRCFQHIADDLIRQLVKLNVPKDERNRIVIEILGSEVNGERTPGLVDCNDEKELDRQLAIKTKSWPPEFVAYLYRSKGGSNCIVNVLKRNMLKPIRIEAGLGNPPNKWDNMRNEAMNSVIKSQCSGKVDQTTIHEILLHKIVEPQYTELQKAVYGLGEYRLSDSFKHLQIPTVEWFQKKPEQRQAVLHKIFKGASTKHSVDQHGIQKHLSVSFEESGISDKIGSWQGQQLYTQAELIINNQQKIISISDKKYCVIDKETAFNVEIKNITTAKIICESKCSSYVGYCGICPHTLAVAENSKLLTKFLEKQNGPSVNDVARNSIPSTAGKKPSTVIRKGKNNKLKMPIVSQVDISGFDNPKACRYSEYFHNDNNFFVVFLKDRKGAIKCMGCGNAFPRLLPIAPYDIVLSHMERYEYYDKNENIWKPTRSKERMVYYCVDPTCILTRHPYFWKGLVVISHDLNFRPSHKDLLKQQLHI